MGLMRTALLAGSRSRWLRERAMRQRFMKRAVARFMPGEELEDAMAAAASLEPRGLHAVLTRLGENVADDREAEGVATHYLDVLERVRPLAGAVEISVKPTQLGLDLDEERCAARLLSLAERAEATGGYVWVDMEQSEYVDATLRLVRRARERHAPVGVCLQAYLRRTAADLDALVPSGAGVRLVKGAYNEPPDVAHQTKKDVDAAYARCLEILMAGPGYPMVGSHDPAIVARAHELAAQHSRAADSWEVQMLYGIRPDEQRRLAAGGTQVRAYVPYGVDWYAYFMRRLAERAANVGCFLRSLATRS